MIQLKNIKLWNFLELKTNEDGPFSQTAHQCSSPVQQQSECLNTSERRVATASQHFNSFNSFDPF